MSNEHAVWLSQDARIVITVITFLAVLAIVIIACLSAAGAFVYHKPPPPLSCKTSGIKEIKTNADGEGDTLIVCNNGIAYWP